MGGILIVAAIAALPAFMGRPRQRLCMAVFGGSSRFGLTGFADDYVKVKKRARRDDRKMKLFPSICHRAGRGMDRDRSNPPSVRFGVTILFSRSA